MQLQKGQKVKFTDLGLTPKFIAECSIQSSITIDISCFGLNEMGKLEDENYMVFYNQKASPNGEVKLIQETPFKFEIDADKLPAKASKLVFTAAIDGNNTMSEIQSLEFKIGAVSFSLTGKDFAKEKAVIIAEVYKRDNIWRINAVGQGFNGGLDALLVSFGGEVAAANPVSIPVKTNQTVFLEKRVNLEKTMEREAPKLVSLAKKAAVSLEKRGLGEHRAKVALCLDISGSMSPMYRSGVIQEFVERILALGCRLDDDGSIDLFLFGANGYQPDPITIKDFNGYIDRMIHSYPLEPDTKYATAIELVRKFYTTYQYERSEPAKQEIPIYVMFLTDGQPSDKTQATRALKNASFEPIFWQFMGVGNADFSYLEKLDDLAGRYIDNADFFSVSSLSAMSDDVLYEKLTNEYPGWVQQAKIKNLIN